MTTNPYILDFEQLFRYAVYLHDKEKATATVQKYIQDIKVLMRYQKGKPLTKRQLILWKEDLLQQYAAASVNTMIAAINSFLEFMGWDHLKVQRVRVQRNLFCFAKKELGKMEYCRLVQAAQDKKNPRLALVIQTICATGIRVSELQYITAEAVRTGYAQVSSKGKCRLIFLPKRLRKLLLHYLQKQKITAGAVFVTRNGKPLDRSNIWREMKALCQNAKVAEEKVFPHNLRHLFARTYYALEKDVSRLADILGHSSINTTRLYTIESGEVHARQLDRMDLVTT